jgi:hypothetical protein
MRWATQIFKLVCTCLVGDVKLAGGGRRRRPEADHHKQNVHLHEMDRPEDHTQQD